MLQEPKNISKNNPPPPPPPHFRPVGDNFFVYLIYVSRPHEYLKNNLPLSPDMDSGLVNFFQMKPPPPPWVQLGYPSIIRLPSYPLTHIHFHVHSC